MQPITLRPYQKQAIDKILWSQKLEGNDLCILPTGAGKSIVIAFLAKELNKPVLILQPGKEILEQNRSKLALYVEKELIGTYSASMNEKTIKQYTFATIQSIYKKPEDFKHFDLVIIDECHLVNPKNLDGMFSSFLEAIGKPKVIGFTATPYRLDLAYRKMGEDFYAYTTIKLINRTKHFFWNRLVFNIDNKELLDSGFLCPIEYIDRSLIKHEEIPMNKSLSDFDMEGFEKALNKKELEILGVIEYAKTVAKSVLVFCSSVKQAENLSKAVQWSATVSAKTPAKIRENIIESFKTGGLHVVFNVGVLTTGFDHPELDCVVLARPTRSIGLYYQMIGRGVRLAPGKASCKVIDLTSTVQNLGKIETIRLEKVEGKWELLSESGSWHNKELYSFKITK